VRNVLNVTVLANEILRWLQVFGKFEHPFCPEYCSIVNTNDMYFNITAVDYIKP